jgi:hypothetical protein
MTKPYSLDLRESYRTGRGGRQRASRCHDLHGERGEWGALVAAASEDGQRRGWEDGRRPTTRRGKSRMFRGS